jgi:predicted ATP-dependent serine protease
VKGWLVPIFMQTDPATGRRLNGLGPQDFNKVREGFACAECLAEFSHYTLKCPVCGWTRDLEADLSEAPQLWQDHLNERENPVDKPRPMNPLVAIENIKKDKDVEQIPVSKLTKSKWGRS